MEVVDVLQGKGGTWFVGRSLLDLSALSGGRGGHLKLFNQWYKGLFQGRGQDAVLEQLDRKVRAQEGNDSHDLKAVRQGRNVFRDGLGGILLVENEVKVAQVQM